jgi:hypothetical protein
MTAEEADVILQISIEDGARLPLIRMSKRCRAVAGRIEANTHGYLRIIGDVAFALPRGIEAMNSYYSSFARSKRAQT